MKKISLTVFAALLFAFQTQCVFAQKNKIETSKRIKQTDKLVKPVEAYAKTIEDFVAGEGKPHLVIADVSDYNKSEKPVWKKYGSEKEFEKARETEESYTIAYIWRKNGKVIAVNFTYSSPSGDWAQYVYHYYREDGTVAKIERELRTFMGDMIVNRIFIYNEKGKLLKETKTFRDLNTGKPVKPNEDFMDMDAEMYKKTGELPFAKLLVKKEKP